MVKKINAMEESAMQTYAQLIIDKLETIKKDWKKPWFTKGGLSDPVNMDGRKYNASNALMLFFLSEREGYKVPVFATFNRFTSLNYDDKGQRIKDAEGNEAPLVLINKGTHSFPVVLSVPQWRNTEDWNDVISPEEYENLSRGEQEKYVFRAFSRYYNVFNIDQTNLSQSRPELYQRLVDKYGNHLDKEVESIDTEAYCNPYIDKMLQDQSWFCPINLKYGDSAFYSLSKDSITIPEKRQFISGESFYGNLLHEMTHSTGAESRLNRLKPGQAFGSAEYAREELVAELGAALACRQMGIEKYVKEDSLPYLKNWLESLKEDAQFIKTVLFDVKSAHDMTMGKIESIRAEMEQGAKDDEEVTNVASMEKNADVEPEAVATAALTPMMKQFLDLKQKHPATLLLFRCGDFYETYEQDAETASKILGITLMKSSKTKDEHGKPLSMAGFPYHALDTYLPKLIRAGQRVAICDQLEDPRLTKKLESRGVSGMAPAPFTIKETISPGIVSDSKETADPPVQIQEQHRVFHR